MKRAACVVVMNSQGKFLAVTRKNSTQIGLPGGKVEMDESLEQAAARELAEETGVKAVRTDLKQVYAAVCPGETDYYTVAFILNKKVDHIPGGQEPDITAKWVDMVELMTNSPFAGYNRDLLLANLD